MAAAVPGMTIDQVTVLNTDGVVLAAGSDAFNASPAKMLSLEKTVAKELQDNVMQTLAPYLGIDNLRVSVALRLNTDKRQINETNFNPEGKAERSVRTVKETGSSQNSERPEGDRRRRAEHSGRPGDARRRTGGEQNKKQNERREELTNYEVSSKTIQTVSEGYKIEKLTIAVVVNRKRMLASLGDGANPEALAKQLKEVERLVESAAGVDCKTRRPHQRRGRGVPAHDTVGEALPAPGIFAQADRSYGQPHPGPSPCWP